MALPESSRPPLPERLLGLLRESRWLLLVAVALYLILILYGYTGANPPWSHSASAAFTRNPGGVLGAGWRMCCSTCSVSPRGGGSR